MVTAVGSTKVNVARFRGRDLNAMAYGSRIIWRKDVAATFTVTVGINPTDVIKCKTIEAVGDVIKTEVSPTKDSYVFTITGGGNVTIKIVSSDGYSVDHLNVDTVNKGSISSYSFTEIEASHTMYLWMKVAEVEQPTDFLQRSDNGQVYSSLQMVLKAIKTDYPGRLTTDITISCIKEATELRDNSDPNKTVSERLFLCQLKDWNKNSIYTLTIDGKNIYSVSGNSLGVMRIENVDNIIIRNIRFSNFANMSEFSTPEEMSAITFIGTALHPTRNIYIENCTFNGTNKDKGSWYTIIGKYVDNITILNNVFQNNAAIIFKLSNTKLINLLKNSISASFRTGILGHPTIMTCANINTLHIEDNDINGDTAVDENLFSVNNVSYVEVKRNKIHGSRGRFINIVSNTSVKKLNIEGNLFRNMLSSYLYEWVKQVIQVSDIDEVSLIGNTVLLNGSMYIQNFILSMGRIGKITNCNNIYIVGAEIGCTFINTKELDGYASCNNLYRSNLKTESVVQFENTCIISSSEGKIMIPPSTGRNLKTLQDSGHETDSIIIPKSTKILSYETGSTGYGLSDTVGNSYLAKIDYMNPFDIDYKKNVYMTSIGAYNYNGVSWNESTDQTMGYAGSNSSNEDKFGNAEIYNSASGNFLLLTHGTLDRNRFVKFLLKGTSDNCLAIGKYTCASPSCVLDGDGNFGMNQIYDIEIETI